HRPGKIAAVLEGRRRSCRIISLQDWQRRRLFLLNLFPPRADLTQRVWRKDVHLFFAERGVAALDFFLEGAAFLEQRGKDVLFRNVGNLFPLHINDPAAIAREDRDVRAFAFAGAVYDAAHDGDLDGELDLARELFADVLHELEQIDL